MIANKSYKYQVTFVINPNFHTLYYGPVLTIERKSMVHHGGKEGWRRDQLVEARNMQKQP